LFESPQEYSPINTYRVSIRVDVNEEWEVIEGTVEDGVIGGLSFFAGGDPGVRGRRFILSGLIDIEQSKVIEFLFGPGFGGRDLGVSEVVVYHD
jgi:hypothetical protein